MQEGSSKHHYIRVISSIKKPRIKDTFSCVSHIRGFTQLSLYIPWRRRPIQSLETTLGNGRSPAIMDQESLIAVDDLCLFL